MNLFLATSCLLISLLTSCTCSKQKDAPLKGEQSEAGVSDGLNLFIWGEYTSPTLLSEFTAKTGIKVHETNFSSNEEMLAKLQAGATGFDIVVPSDYMVAVMIQLDLLDRIDKAATPNAQGLDPALMGREFDPSNLFSLPYSWSATGIAYSKSKAKAGIKGYQDLLTSSALQQRVTLLDDMREAFATALRIQGDSVNTIDDAKLTKASRFLIEAKKHILAFNSSPAQALIQGDIIAAQMYSNEALRTHRKNNDIEFVLPSEGTTMAIDSMVVLKSSSHKVEAHKFINFMLSSDVNRRFSEELLTAPVAMQVAEKLPEDMRQNPVIAKAAELAKTSEALKDLGPKIVVYDRLWTEIKAR